MAFSFNPGQQAQTPAPQGEAPPLIVPSAPVISTTAPVEVISPFAYKNRNKSQFSVYFQFSIFLITGIAILVSVVLFAYQRVLIAQVEGKKQELAEKEKAFPKLELDKMVELSNRITIINKILNERASVKTAFSLLESTVLDNSVTFTRFSLSKNKSNKGYSLSFGGETTSYPALYQQIATLNEKRFSKYFSKIVISGIGPLDKKGIGSFRADTVINIEGIDPDTFTIDPPVSLNNSNTLDSTSTQNNQTSQTGNISSTTPQSGFREIPILQ